jgi:hypothetical protein
MPESMHSNAQGVQRYIRSWKEFNGLVFGDSSYTLISNEKEELINFMFTPGDVDDRGPLYNKNFIDQIVGRLVGDKGYISKKLFQVQKQLLKMSSNSRYLNVCLCFLCHTCFRNEIY